MNRPTKEALENMRRECSCQCNACAKYTYKRVARLLFSEIDALGAENAAAARFGAQLIEKNDKLREVVADAIAHLLGLDNTNDAHTALIKRLADAAVAP